MTLTGEDRLLAWLRERLPGSLIGDDAALLPPLESCAVTVDSQIAGVHVPPDLDEATFARRLLAVNLSDLAAVGATPAWAFLALAAPPGFDHRRFFRALLAACRPHRLALAGGDLAKSPLLTAALTLIGTKGEDASWLRRNAAEPGEVLWLGGTVGESAAGRLLIERGARLAGRRIDLPPGIPSSLQNAARRAVRRHLQPQAQLELGGWLGKQAAGAALDVSDGVARDLHRLCRESGTGALVFAEAIPFAPRFEDLCATIGADPLDLALGGGEDYVLLFTLPFGLTPPEGWRIGRVTQEREISLHREGARSVLPALGWDHFTSR